MTLVSPMTADKGYVFRIYTELFPIGQEWTDISRDLCMSSLHSMRATARTNIDSRFPGWERRAAVVSGLAQLRQLIFKNIITPDLQSLLPEGSVLVLGGGPVWIPVGPYHVLGGEAAYRQGTDLKKMIVQKTVNDPEQNNKAYTLTAVVWVNVEALEGLTP